VTAILVILGHILYYWKGIFKTFPVVYYKPQIHEILLGNPKKQIA
jgi:hypothetical protein